MTGRGEGLEPPKRGERTQQSHSAFDPAREAQSGGLKPEQISSAEKKLRTIADPTLQYQGEQGEQWLSRHASERGSEEYQQRKKALELIEQEQKRRASAGELLAQVEAQGYQKPGVRDQGSQYSSGGGIFDQGSYRSR